jgi:hypothetical protein
MKDMIVCYNGRPSVLYVKLFYEHLDLFNSIVEQVARASTASRVSNSSAERPCGTVRLTS